MTHEFDREFWEQHWKQGGADGRGSMAGNPPSPYLAREVSGLTPGTALDAGCGAGAEAVWLAEHGWQVTAVDIAAEALHRAAERARASGAAGRLEWIEEDLGAWDPGTQFDLVATHYAHPAMPQLEFYDRLASWVAPGGTLLIVGHSPANSAHGDGHPSGAEHRHADDNQTPAEASATAAAVTAGLDPHRWEVVTAEERRRTLGGKRDREVALHDVVVRAVRRLTRSPLAP
jgi:SAM-dependent methyltransferase